MAKRVDVQKREEWQRRLERFEGSGRTISQFCSKESIPPHQFYYWAKRLRNQSSRSRNASLRETVKKNTPRPAQRREDEGAWARPAERMVHFHWNSKLQVAIPADCLDAIRCVLDCANHMEESYGSSPAGAFRQVIMG